jgi:aminoethylphosphonate catabolism LysR family transcriptional regulator
MNNYSGAELKAFEVTARSGSMSAAAQLLGIKQPTVSAHITSIETRYGVELFHRKGRGVELTEFGKLLHEITNRLFQVEEQARLLLLSARCQYQGHLKLCAVGPYNVTPMIKAFRKKFSNVRVSVAICDSRKIVQRILDFEDDIGILLHSVDDAHVHCVPYKRQPLIVFSAKDHPLAQPKKLYLKDLQGQEFVMREDGSRTRAIFEACLKAADIRIRSSLEMGSREAVREAVAQGLGLGIVARTAYVADQRLTVLPIEDINISSHVHVICLKERIGASLIERFLKVVNESKNSP